MRIYPQSQREEVLRALIRGENPTGIARRLGVSRVWVYNVRNRERSTGERTAHRVGWERKSNLVAMEKTIRDLLRSEPTLTLNQLRELLSGMKLSVKNGALWRQLDKWNLTYKKNARRQRARERRKNPQKSG